MTSKEEHAYSRGMQAGYREMLAVAMRGLYEDPKLQDRAKLALRETTTREALRAICAEFGDNDWPDDLSFGDVLEKHLARHLRARLQK